MLVQHFAKCVRHIRDDKNRGEESGQGVVDGVQSSGERTVYRFDVLRDRLSFGAEEALQSRTFENLFRRRP